MFLVPSIKIRQTAWKDIPSYLCKFTTIRDVEMLSLLSLIDIDEAAIDLAGSVHLLFLKIPHSN